MAVGAAAAVVVGTAISIKAKKKEAEAQARAARKNAQAKREQALELLDRLEVNNQSLLLEGELLKGKQETDFASRGIDVGVGSALSTIEETNSLVSRQLLIDRREADFKVKQLRSGADADVRLAGDVKSAARLAQTGMLLSGAGKLAGGS